MNLIEDDYIDEVHYHGGCEKVAAECRANVQGYGKYERREKVEKRFVDLERVSLHQPGNNLSVQLTS